MNCSGFMALFRFIKKYVNIRANATRRQYEVSGLARSAGKTRRLALPNTLMPHQTPVLFLPSLHCLDPACASPVCSFYVLNSAVKTQFAGECTF